MNQIGPIWAVVPCFNRSANTLRFLASFFRQDYVDKHVVIVDDGSSDQTAFNVRCNYPSAHVVEGDGSLWWAGGTNLGIRYALERGARYILTINDDAQFDPTLLSTLAAVAADDPRYIVGAVIMMETAPGIIWSVGSSTALEDPRLMRLNHAGQHASLLDCLADPFPVSYMPGNGVLLPAAVFKTVGLYDEVNFPQYHADSELVLRARLSGNFLPVISLKARVLNQILMCPLVTNVKDLLFSKKSDLYWPALATFFIRHHPEVDLREVFNRLYSPFQTGLEIPESIEYRA